MSSPSTSPTVASVRPFPAWAPWFFIAPFLLVFATFTVWPLLSSLVLSVQQTYGPGATHFVGFDNFTFMMQDPFFWKAVRNTAIFAAGSVFLQLPLSLGLALLLNRPGLRGRSFFRLVFFSPSLVGLVFVGVIFALVFEKRTGLMNASLHALFPAFDPEFAWLQTYVMPALIVAALWLYVGFNMVYFLAALQNVSRDLLEAASIDGANAWQRFRHVIVPQIAPIAVLVILMSIIGSFQLFELPWVLLNNSAGPDQRGLTIVMYLYQTGFLAGDLGYASAVGWVLALTLASIALVHRRLSRRSEES
jgi:ABC-type sugar transport system permease subunit